MRKEKTQKFGDRLRTSGWKTGSVLCPVLTKAVAKCLQRGGRDVRVLAENECLIVVSQTCDVLASKLETEPYVEVLVARERVNIDSTKARLRSTRHLNFRTKRGGTILEAHATDRYWVPRDMLSEFAPDSSRSLSEQASRLLVDWIGLRYTRRAWPNSLVERLPNIDEMEQLLKDIELDVAEIRVAIPEIDEELPKDVPYRLTVFAVMETEVFNSNPTARAACYRAFNALLTNLRARPGIQISEDSDLFPGNEFNWELLEMTDRWNLANLTEQEGE